MWRLWLPGTIDLRELPVLGLIAVQENADDIELYKPATVQDSKDNFRPSDINPLGSTGVVTFREDLVESDGTTQMYLVMAGLDNDRRDHDSTERATFVSPTGDRISMARHFNYSVPLQP